MNNGQSFFYRVCSLRSISFAIYFSLVTFNGCSEEENRIDLDSSSFPYQYIQKEIYSKPHSYLHFFDLDGDLVDERVYVSYGEGPNQSLVLATKLDGSIISQINLPPARAISCLLTIDVNNDDHRELLIKTREGKLTFAYVIDVFKSTIIKRYLLKSPIDGKQNLPEDVSIDPLEILKNNKNGEAIIVCSCVATKSLRPRGVIGVDYESGKYKWYFPAGTWPGRFVFSDINNDGSDEIFFSSNAPANGVSENGTDDFHSYVIGISIEGKSLWSPLILGEKYSASTIALSDLDLDNKSELICWYLSSNKVIERSYIAIIDPLTGLMKTRKKEFESRLSLPFFRTNDEHTFTQYIPAVTEDGHLYLYDKFFAHFLHKILELNICSFRLVYSPLSSEIAYSLTLSDGTFILLDKAYNPIFKREEVQNFKTIRNGTGKNPFVILESNNVHSIGIIQRSSFYYERLIQYSLAFLVFILVTLPLIYCIYKSSFYYQAYCISTQTGIQGASLLLDRRHRIIHYNSEFMKIFKLKGAIQKKQQWKIPFDNILHSNIIEFIQRSFDLKLNSQTQLSISEEKQIILLDTKCNPITFGGMLSGYFFSFSNTTEIHNYERAINWTLFAQNLSHQMKSPLSTLWFTIERIRQRVPSKHSYKEIQANLDSISEETRNLDRYIKGFLKLTKIQPPILCPTDLNEIIKMPIKSYSEKIPSTVKIETDFDKELPLVHLDVQLFTQAITNIIDNAINAIRKGGTIKVSTYLVQNLKENLVCLSISDTGKGIDKEDIPKIFTPYFSKTEGGSGLGLAISKKIIEDHSGFITFNTKEGLGTEFIIHLQAAPSRQGESDV